MTGKKIRWVYREQARKGDHICYISDLRKLESISRAGVLREVSTSILEEMVAAERQHAHSAGTD